MESLETEALFSIITAMETILQLILQFAIIYYLAYSDQGILPAILVVSVVALCLSASHNTGLAVMYQMSKKWTFEVDVSGLVAGKLHYFGPRCCIESFKKILSYNFDIPHQAPHKNSILESILEHGVELATDPCGFVFGHGCARHVYRWCCAPSVLSRDSCNLGFWEFHFW